MVQCSAASGLGGLIGAKAEDGDGAARTAIEQVRKDPCCGFRQDVPPAAAQQQRHYRGALSLVLIYK